MSLYFCRFQHEVLNLLSIDSTLYRSYFGHSTLVGQRLMKLFTSVCPSVATRPSLSFLKIGLLVFSDILHGDS